MYKFSRLSTHSAAKILDPRLIRVYGLYRLLLAALLLLLANVEFASDIFRGRSGYFGITLQLYLALTLLSYGHLMYKRWRASSTRFFIILLLDAGFISLLSFLGTGSSIGLSNLFLVIVSAAGISLSGIYSLAVAAVVTILVLVEALASSVIYKIPDSEIVSAGLFGILLFLTAAFFYVISRRLRDAEAQVAAETQRAKQFQELNARIIDRMHTGIIVLDQSMMITLCNDSAARMFGTNSEGMKPQSGVHLNYFPELYQQYQLWRRIKQRKLPVIHSATTGIPLNISFAPLHDEQGNLLMFVEDARQIAQYAQQLKTASLGRLSSSIAHEIRNPLAAISHASQLLAQASGLNAEDQHLIDVIQRHTVRVNNLVVDTMSLAQQRTPDFKRVDLEASCRETIEEFLHGEPEANVELENLSGGQQIIVPFDKGHLQQIVTNLLGNATHYSNEAGHGKSARITIDISPDNDIPVLEVFDNGPGVSWEILDSLFEPFFTTRRDGTGLGLYISRELCEINHATLSYIDGEEGNHLFRVVFSHPAKALKEVVEIGT